MIPRFFVDPALWVQPVITLGQADSHHLADVLRARVADAIMVLDGAGGEARAEITSLSPSAVTARVVAREEHRDPGTLITLVQAVPKAQKMDWIIQKATEIGVCSILPVMTDRGVVKLEDERADKRTERWQRIAVEAAKQCRTAWIPLVRPVQSLEAVLLSEPPAEVLVIGSLEEQAIPLKRCLRELLPRRPKSVALLIGPEGDFSPREAELARKAGAIPVSYGSHVLRVETASIYGLCVLAYELSSPPGESGKV